MQSLGAILAAGYDTAPVCFPRVSALFAKAQPCARRRSFFLGTVDRFDDGGELLGGAVWASWARYTAAVSRAWAKASVTV